MAKKKITPKGIFNLLKTSFNGFLDDKVVKLSAALAYYTVFSIGPTIIIIIYFAGAIYGQEAVQGTIFNELKGLVGAQAALQVQEMIKNVAANSQGSFGFTARYDERGFPVEVTNLGPDGRPARYDASVRPGMAAESRPGPR